MRPYKIVIGCTQILRSDAASEIIKFQLYSQLDYNSLKFSVQKHIKVLEQVIEGDILHVSFCPPEITCSKTSLPYISWYIRLSNQEVPYLLKLIKQLFPKQLYIEVQ